MSSNTKRVKQDPWPEMEKQITDALNDLVVQHQKFAATTNRTVVVESTLKEAISAVEEILEIMQHALDQVIEHPELFAISTEELQRRGNLVRQWQRDIKKPSEELMECQRRREQSHQAASTGSSQFADKKREADGEYLKQEYENQVGMMQDQDHIVDRLHSGVVRVKNNAVLINEELKKQDHMLTEADTQMSKLQTRLEGALKKVNTLLDQSSDRNKYICIFVLLIVLGLLVFLLFGGN